MLWHDRGRKSVAAVLVLFALPLPWPNTLCSLAPFTEELFPAREPIPVCDILYLKKKKHTSIYRHLFPKLVLFHDESALFLGILSSFHVLSGTVSTHLMKEAFWMSFGYLAGNETIYIYNYCFGFRNQSWRSEYLIPNALCMYMWTAFSW